LILEELFVGPAGGAYPVVCVWVLTAQYSAGDTILSKSTVLRMRP